MTKFFTYSAAVLAGLVLVASTQEASAQNFSKRKQYTSIGFTLNTANYFGDIVPKVNFASFRGGDTRYNVGISVMRRLYPRISLRGNLSYSRLAGDDQKAADPNDENARFRNMRNMTIRNNVVEANGQVVVDLIENRNKYIKRPDFVPYVFAGVGVFYHNPMGLVKDNSISTDGLTVGQYYSLQSANTEGANYSKVALSIPFGGGVRYRINRNLDASFEVSWHKTFTDYLDDVSGKFQDPSKLNGSVAQYFGRDVTAKTAVAGFNNPGEIRGKKGDDWFILTGFSLNYILSPKIKNPKFR